MIRWIFAIPFFLLFGILAVGHIVGMWLFYVKKQKVGSMVPFLGGISGVARLAILDWKLALCWFWIPLLSDLGCLPIGLAWVLYGRVPLQKNGLARGRGLMMKINRNLRNIGLAVLLGCVLFPFLALTADLELYVEPSAPVQEIFKAAEKAVGRLEELPPETFTASTRPGSMKAVRAWQDIAALDEQLLNYVFLRELYGGESLELKWRQYPAGCRDKRILLLLLSWNYLPDRFDDEAYPDGTIRFWDLSAWNPASREYRERREEIEYVRKHGRAAHDRITRTIAKGYSESCWTQGFILGGCLLWWLGCAVLHPFLRRKENGHNFPTTASVTVRWLGILVPVAVMAVVLILQTIKG